MEAKFTKGDWKVIGGGIRNSEHDLILKPTQHGSSIFINISTPDAKLIEAAPKLYKALDNLLSRVSNDADSMLWFSKEQEDAVAALKQARGEDV